MKITEISIQRPPLVVVFVTVLLILGLVSFSALKFELLPDITPPYVAVVTVYPGASPQEVESEVTKSIEEAIADIGKVVHVTSISTEGISQVQLEFENGVDPLVANQNVQKKMASVMASLPNGAKTPAVYSFSLKDYPVLQVGVQSQLEQKALQDLVKEVVKPRLSRIKGVGWVRVAGAQGREVQVNLDMARLSHLKMPVLGVVESLRSAGSDIPAGTMKAEDGQIMTRVSGRFTTLEELADTQVAQGSGAPVLLRDVAEIQDGTTDLTSISRIDGKEAVILQIGRQSGANDVEMSALVRAEIATLEAEYQASALKFDIAQDGSEFTLKSAEAVSHDLVLAILLVALVMVGFLQSFRSSMIVMVSVPVSIVSTFIGIYLFGFTLNLMTLLALSLVIGILVDDSIVVLENIYRHLEMGKTRRQAALDGRNEIGFAAVSITMVDIVVFLPLVFVSGLIGNIVRQYALVVVISTLVSLIVSFTVTPMLASRFAKLEDPNRKTLMGWFGRWFERGFEKVLHLYQTVLKFCLGHPLATLGTAGLLLVGALTLPALGLVGSEFTPPIDKGQIQVDIEASMRKDLLSTNRYVLDLENKIWTLPEVRKVIATAGSTGDGGEPYTGQLTVFLAPPSERTRSSAQVSQDISDLGKQIPGIRIQTSPIGLFGSGDPFVVAIGLTGSDREALQKAAEQVKATMLAIPGTGEVKLSTNQGKPQIDIQIDRKKMSQLGLSLDMVGAHLRTAINGNDELKLRDGTKEIPIRIRADVADVRSVSDLEGMRFLNKEGTEVELRQFATITSTMGPDRLQRLDRLSTITVMCQAIGRPSGDVSNEVIEKIERLSLAGVSITEQGEGKQMEEAFTSLAVALVIAIVFVYLIMVALFNSFRSPFIVLFSIPVAIIGALVGLVLAAKTLNIFSFLGIIMLVGLVGKHAIILVDRANAQRAAGMSVRDSILSAGATRFRPILMTTLSTVFGMLPIAFAAEGSGAELKASLGVVQIGGLTGSLLLTIFLVPTIYNLIEGALEKRQARKAAAVTPGEKQ